MVTMVLREEAHIDKAPTSIVLRELVNSRKTSEYTVPILVLLGHCIQGLAR